MRPLQQLLCGGAVGMLILFLTFRLQNTHAGPSRLTHFVEKTAEYTQTHLHSGHTHRPAGTEEKIAYATFLSTRTEDDEAPDPYFTAARVLAYQLLHHPTTRTQLDIPFLVVVTPIVSEAKRARLAADGAIIVPVELLTAKDDWAKPGNEKWIDQFSKLRLFNLTAYDRILYIDGDMLLTKPLDGIWDEDVAWPVRTLRNKKNVKDDEAPLPDEYMLTGVSDAGGAHHAWPLREGDDLNGGFFMLKPSARVFDYYISLMNIPNRFDAAFMEQSLLTYAHRRDGNMPWKPFPAGKWNANWPGLQDVEGGAASLHDKFWEPENKDWMDRELVEMWWRMQGQMEGYWQRRDEEGTPRELA